MSVLAFQPSYWQRLAVGGLAVSVTVPVLVVVVELVRRHVLEPRAAARRWPEGLGRWAVGELAAELVSAAQTEDVLPSGSRRSLADVALAGACAAACGSLIVLPVSTSIMAVDPAAGVALLPLAVLLWAGFDFVLSVAVGVPSGLGLLRQQAARRMVAALSLALGALAVAAQAGSGSLVSVLRWQAHRSTFGHPGPGMPFALVQAPALAAVLVALHTLAMSGGPDTGPVREIGGLRRAIARAADTTVLVAAAAWVAAAFLGGGEVPWHIGDVAVRTGVAVVLFGGKVVVVLGGLVWALGRWPELPAPRALAVVGGGAVLAAFDVAATVALRAWF